MSKEIIKHLLIPKEFRVWCRPNNPIQPQMVTTTKPSETGCCNCLTAWRTKTTGKAQPFRRTNAAGRRHWSERGLGINDNRPIDQIDP